ncbi:MAG: hypothetical protein NVSMB21_22190 [Vulcanimicrobiaceae bacterium]
MAASRAALAAFVMVATVAVPRPGRAIPPPEPPRAGAEPSATPVADVAGSTLPAGSDVFFVLDERIDSGSTKPGTIVHAHLKAPLTVGGATIAPAGAPETLSIVTTRHAQSGDVDGAIQIHLDPLALPGRTLALPIRAYHEYLTVQRTGGQQATRGTTDTIGDIFIPYHALYHAFRRGRQLVLPAGSMVRAQTAASVDARDPRALVISTPPPFVSTFDVPHADLTPPPFYTPAPIRPKPLPKGKPTFPPSTATPAPAAKPATASPSATPHT